MKVASGTKLGKKLYASMIPKNSCRQGTPLPNHNIDTRASQNIRELLRRCEDEKTTAGGYSAALRLAREAYELCSSEEFRNSLQQPWPQLAAYRLAILLARGNPRNADFLEIDGLLQFAMSVKSASGLPIIWMAPFYALANQFRMKKNQRTQRSSDEMWEIASNIVERSGRSSSRPIPTIESESFNMYELLAIAAGKDMSSLGGRGALSFDSWISGDRPWRLWSSLGHQGNVRMNESIANAEIGGWSKKYPRAVFVKLWKDSSCLRIGSEGSEEVTEDARALGRTLISCLSESPVIYGANDNPARFRKSLSRAIEKISLLSAGEVGSPFTTGLPNRGLTHDPEIFVISTSSSRG